MDLEKLLSKQEKCINDNPPACITKCPIHVDVKSFIGEVRKENFEEAYRILKKRIPFVNIIGMVCDHPCEGHCLISGHGEGLSIHELEKAVISYGKKAKIKMLKIPSNNKKIAVIGGGISGLTCAVDLNQKGYKVIIFEKESTVGGSLLKISGKEIDLKTIQEEIDDLAKLGVEIKINNNISKEELDKISKEFDAVYVGTGTWSEKLNVDPVTLQTDTSNIFAGGKIIHNNDSVIQSVSLGRRAAISIDRFVNGKSMTALRENEGAYESKLEPSYDNCKITERIKPSGIYSKEEALAEASRCIQCECHKCVKACKHLQNIKLDPKSYIRTINQNERIILGDHYANKIINSCAMCGLCNAVCPSSINMAEIIKETRQSMVEKGKMPISAHDYALKDMDFSISEYFELTKHEPGKDKSTYVFFPGCQLSASYPEHVIKTYEYLTKRLQGGVGLYLSCCGAPADWAGQKELFHSNMDKIKNNLEKMGNPVIIAACSTCFNNFKHELKDIKIKSLWEVMVEEGIPEEAVKGNGKTLMVHDACTTREESIIHESIRKIAEELDYNIEEPYFTKGTTKCCGYGGNLYFSNRKFSREVSKDRIEDSDNDFLVYCAMCRDLFVLSGKKSYHALDLLFGQCNKELSIIDVPTLSERRRNRFKLKKYMLEKLWGEKMEVESQHDDINIIVEADLRNKIEEQLILDSDIKEVIYNSEKTKNSFYNPENGHTLAYNRSVNITFWVEYEKTHNGYKVINAYSHRMDVTGV